MIKRIALLLTCLLIPLCAFAETPAAAGQYPRNDRGIIQLTVDEAAPYVQRVTLTEANWQEYFSNIVQPYHFEVRNEFGDVSLSEEQTLHYFTVTGYDAVHFDEVAFKFGHSIEYSSRGADDNGVVRYSCWERIIAEDGTARLARYYEGEEPTEWSEIDPPQAGYYVARDFTSSSQCHYFDFLGVTGEIVLFSFPDELWTLYGDQEMLYIGDYPLYRHQENNPFLWEITRDLFQ